MRLVSASSRAQLIRQASELPKGSEERKTILAQLTGLERVDDFENYSKEAWYTVPGEVETKRPIYATFRLSRIARSGDPRPFSKVDWYGYSGATRFEDGPPVIASAGDTKVVEGYPDVVMMADAEGFYVEFIDEDGEAVTYIKDTPAPSQAEALPLLGNLLRQVKSGRLPPGFKKSPY